MGVQVLAWAMNQNVGEPTAKLILIILSDLYNDKYGCAFPSQEYISKKANCSVRTIQRHMDILVKGGFIEIIKKPNHVNNYLIKHLKNVSDNLSPKEMDATNMLNGSDNAVTRSLNTHLNTSISKDIEGTSDDLDNKIYQLKYEKVFRVHKEYLIQKGYKKAEAGQIVGTMMKRLSQSGLTKDQAVDKVEEIFKSIKASPVADIKSYLFGAVIKKADKPKELSEKQLNYIQSVLDQIYKKKDMPSYAGTDFVRLRSDCEKAMLEGKMQSILDEFHIQ